MERTFYWHFVLSLKNRRLVFLSKCIISAKFFLSHWKSNFEKFWFRFYGPRKMPVLYFSIFDFDNFLTTFAKDLMKKPIIFITNIKSTHNFLHLEISDNETTTFLKILWKLHGNVFSLQISATIRKFETCIYIEIRNFG